MLNDTLLPDVPSTELDVINQLIRRTVRHARARVDSLQPDEVMTLPEVQALMAFITQQVQGAFDAPALFLTQPIWAEYVNKESWTLKEAAALTAGLDPFYYSILPKAYPQLSAECLNTICYRIIMLDAPCTGHNAMAPGDFCRWALDTDVVHEFARPFFRELGIKSLRPERIFDACGDVPSPLRTAHF